MQTIESAAELLLKGKILIFPTDTVYGIGALHSHPEAIERLYALKNRPRHKPLIALIHTPPLNMPKTFYHLAEHFWPGPLTLIASSTGYRMPAHPTTQKLLQLTGQPILTTSANLSNHPAPTKPADITISADAQLLLGPHPFGTASTIYDLDSQTLLRSGPITLTQIKNCLSSI